VARKQLPADAVIVYTDGACTGNPGPMGIGVVISDGKERREISEYLGVGTNNIAELTAIERALEQCPRERTVVVHSDSAYALGLLGQNWKAKKNQELVARLRELAAQFKDVRWVKVAGHAGVPENERCDQLARDAIQRAFQARRR
jgi:ribonuclease HI